MAHTQKRRPFPKQLFEQLSKVECEHFLEALHYTTEAENTADVKDALSRFQNLFPFTRVIGGLARLSPQGAFEGFTNVINVSYPEEWIRLYWQNGYFEVDPVFQTALQKPGTQHWQTTYRAASSVKQQEFMAAAREFGLADGITTGSADPACRVATFCSFASADSIDATRYVPLVEYFGYHVHLALLRTAPKNPQSMDRCVKQLTLRELTILNWVKNGKTNWEIAQIMGVTERTIRFHVESIFSKLDVTSRSQAVATAIEHGLPNVV
ncbi:MAG TPA: LuxR family transcriptional regulator [Nitrospiraceae bacterium]|jgi:DNA-binding CsgD family transcriptional regulator|nr:LuxR family transcriptional regulator [Nitrospiraceae bacterium]